MRRLWHLIGRAGLEGAVRVFDNGLTEDELAKLVAVGDLVALPFELVASDAPLSVLEARVLGVPVVTTRVGCLPELAGGDPSWLALPGDPNSLCEALLAAASQRERCPTGVFRGWDQVSAEWSALVRGV
jgi:glycosyltransferase involved in cell wall biosynthesis